MANDYVRQQFDSRTLTGWTAGSWSVVGNALSRTSWVSPDVLPDVAFYATGIGRGDCEIKANVWADAGAEVGLQVLTEASGTNGYEFRLSRANNLVEIWKIVDDAYTLLASASPGTITADQWIRLRGRLTSLDYDNWSAGASLALYMDDEDTALVSYSDRLQPCPRGDSFIGVRAMSSAGQDVKVDDVTLRRLLSVEAEDSFETPVWTWGRLADHALLRLEGGGNAQFSRDLMIELLAFAEQELAVKANKPWWLDRVYTLTTSSRLNDLPAWIDQVKSGYIDGQSTPLKIVNREVHNVKEPARNKTGTVNKLVFLGMTDALERRYEIDPAPTGSTSLTLYVVAKPGYVVDGGQAPLVPPEHAEVLIFGALRRAYRHDRDARAVRDNEQLWQEGIRAVIRDHYNKTAPDGGQMITDREFRKDGTQWSGLWYRDPKYVNPR